MRYIKYLLVILMAFSLKTINVFAEGPKAESSLLEVDGVTLFEKGSKLSNEVSGVTFDENTMTLTVSSNIDFKNSVGIKIMNMGDQFTLVLDGPVNYSLNERNDGIFIKDTSLTLKQVNNGSLKVTTEEGSGIIIDGTAILHAEDVTLEVGTIRFKKNSFDIWDTGNIVNTEIYAEGNLVSADDVKIASPSIDIAPVPSEDPQPSSRPVPYKRKDTLDSVMVYVIIAGALILCSIIAVIANAKKEKK